MAGITQAWPASPPNSQYCPRMAGIATGRQRHSRVGTALSGAPVLAYGKLGV